MPASRAKTGAPAPARGSKLTIGFGLVNVNVKYAPLVKSAAGRTAATTCCRTHMAPVKSEYRCTEGGELVAQGDKVMAYEVDGRFVEVDTAALGLDSDKRLELVAAVDVAQIDPLYFEKAYAVWPEDDAAGQGYDLIAAVLRESGKALVGTSVMGKATKAVVLRWSELAGCLLVHTCTYDARVSWDDVVLVRASAAARPALPAQLVATAQMLFGSLADDFDFAEVDDEYATQLDDAIALAAAGKKAKAKVQEPEAAPVDDLMAALEASVAAASAKPKARKKVAA